MKNVPPQLDAPTINIAENQPEYIPVVGALVHNPGYGVPYGRTANTVVLAYEPSAEERARVTAGEPIYLSLLTFGGAVQPHILSVGAKAVSAIYNVRVKPSEGPQHVCGLQGFGRSFDDVCEACERVVHFIVNGRPYTVPADYKLKRDQAPVAYVRWDDLIHLVEPNTSVPSNQFRVLGQGGNAFVYGHIFTIRPGMVFHVTASTPVRPTPPQTVFINGQPHTIPWDTVASHVIKKLAGFNRTDTARVSSRRPGADASTEETGSGIAVCDGLRLYVTAAA